MHERSVLKQKLSLTLLILLLGLPALESTVKWPGIFKKPLVGKVSLYIPTPGISYSVGVSENSWHGFLQAILAASTA